MKKYLGVFFLILLSSPFAAAQRAEVTIQLNEQFFDAVLDAIFSSAVPLEFPLAVKDFTDDSFAAADENRRSTSFGYALRKNEMMFAGYATKAGRGAVCSETVRLQREIGGVRTAVRFRDGQVYAPIAFAGNYNPPLIGCVGFSGWAETIINLEFDQNAQRLVGHARVTNVSLSGTGGIGGSLLTRLVQSAIDKRVNPIQILQTDKISFVVPIQNSGSIKMKAVGIKPEISSGVLNVRVVYEFMK